MPNVFFNEEKQELLDSRLGDYDTAKVNGTVSSHFLPSVMDDYRARWPEDDVAEVPYEPMRTKSGRRSKKRPAGVPKPLREVSKVY